MRRPVAACRGGHCECARTTRAHNEDSRTRRPPRCCPPPAKLGVHRRDSALRQQPKASWTCPRSRQRLCRGRAASLGLVRECWTCQRGNIQGRREKLRTVERGVGPSNPTTPVERVNRAHVGLGKDGARRGGGPFAPSIRVNELLPRGTRNVLVAINRRGIAAAARRALVSARGPRPRPDRDRTQDAALLRTAPAHQDGETALASSNGRTASSTPVSPRTVRTGHGAVRTTRSAMLPIRR